MAVKRKAMLLAASLGMLALVGCGGSGGSTTAVMGLVEGAAGTTSGVTLKVTQSDEGFSESYDLDSDGEFMARKVPEGFAKVEIERSGETETLDMTVEVEQGETTEIDVFLMTWSPEAVGEYRVKVGDGSYGIMTPLGPTGTTMSTNSSGDHVLETPNGLVVTKSSDGTVDVDDSNYTAPSS